MSRTAHFSIGVGVILLCILWCFFGVFMFWAVAAGKDSRGTSVSDLPFITVYIVFGAGLLAGLWFAFLSFRRALRPPRLDSPLKPPALPIAQESQHSLETPDERLAHLMRKTDK